MKDIANLKQFYTQYGGARPFGVSILFAGVDDSGPQLYVTDVTGIYFQFKATVVGEGEVQIKEILDKEYRSDIDINDGIKLAVSAFKRVFGKEFDVDRLDGAYIKTSDKTFARIDAEALKKIARKT